MRHALCTGVLMTTAFFGFACSSGDDGSDPTDPTSDPMDSTDPSNEPSGMMGSPSDPVGSDDPIGSMGEPPIGEDPGLALDECGLATDFIGDEYCILPPPEGEGFQIHYGPSDYDNPDEVALYLLEPGGETNIYEPAVSGNESDIFFYRRQYRMRPGSHHLIITESGGGGSVLGQGRRLGGSQNTAKDNPTVLAPENEGIGIPLSAHAPLSLNLHHFNGSSEPILKEAWINFWYIDEADVTQQANEMFLWVQGPEVPSGQSALVVGSWDITQEGRVLTMYGHRHSNTPRFSAYHVRDGSRTLIYDDYDWFEPSVFEFNSVTENPTPQVGSNVSGATSGVLELLPGDSLEWECEIVNEHDFTVTFGANEAVTSEMCILIGDAVGPELMGFTLAR